MARLLGPDGGSRMAILPTGAPAASRTGVVYANAAGSALADILAYQPANPTVPGAAIAGSVVTTDAYGMLPLWWWPDGVDVVWISVNGGPVVAINADYDARLDVVETGVQTKADAALVAAKAYTDATVSNVADALIPVTAPLISTPLAAGAVFTSAPLSGYWLGHPAQHRAVIRLTATSDVTYTLTVDSSIDGIAWAQQNSYTPTLVAALWTVDVTVDPTNRYVRFVVTAGGAQSALSVKAVFS